MDGGEKQKEKAEWLKQEVKRKAGDRRERRFLQNLESEMEGLDVTRVSGSASLDESMEVEDREDMMALDDPTETSRPIREMSISTSCGSSSARSNQHAMGPTAAVAPAAGVLSAGVPVSSPSSSSTDHQVPLLPGAQSLLIPPHLSESDTSFLMLYLDFVFPFLFPFYRPPFLHSGRGWLLSLLMRNKSLLHGALGVASHFWTVTTQHPTSEVVVHQACSNTGWLEMQRQQELTLQELQRDMQSLLTRGVRGFPAESTRVLASIVQVLTFEVAIANTGNWEMHLTAAVELFGAIMENHAHAHAYGTPRSCGGDNGVDDDGEVRGEEEVGGICTCFGDLLSQIGPGPGIHTIHNRPWSSDQAALRFFTAYLLFFDTLASTSLEQPPRLARWHRHLLLASSESSPSPLAPGATPSSSSESSSSSFSSPGPHRQSSSAARPGDATQSGTQTGGENENGQYPSPHINLEEFLGIQNWVLLAISRISSLSAWKKSQKSRGSLSINQLMSRSSAIEQYIRENLALIDVSFLNNPPCPTQGKNPLDPLEQYTHYAMRMTSAGGGLLGDTVKGLTYVWGTAALTYLSVVVSGWQPLSQEIRDSVRLTIAMLRALPTASCVRTCVWPFTVTGCLVSSHEEREAFRETVRQMGGLGLLGSMTAALGVMEGVWRWTDMRERRGRGFGEGLGTRGLSGEEEGGRWDLDMELDLGVVLSGALGLGGAEGQGMKRRVLLV